MTPDPVDRDDKIDTPAAAGLSDYLKDGCGEPSTMRLMAFAALLIGTGFGVAGVWMDSRTALDLAIWLWGFAFTGKAAQSYAERDQTCGTGPAQ